MEPIRAITLHQPWASVVGRGKNHETRSWSNSYRGLLAIHAGITYPKWAEEMSEGEPFASSLAALEGLVPLGSVVAVAQLTAIHRVELVIPSILDRAFGDWTPGRCAWRLEDIILLDEPIPCCGAQGLWTLPEDVEAKVRHQMIALSATCAVPGCASDVEWDFGPDESLCQDHWESFTSYTWWEGGEVSIKEWLEAET